MLAQKNVTIDGEDFQITTFPATRGFRILKELTRLLGPAFAEWAKGGEDGMALAVNAIVDNLDSVNVENLVKELISSVSKGSVAVNFDMEFAGNYNKLFLLVREVIQLNYGSVFTVLGSVG